MAGHLSSVHWSEKHFEPYLSRPPTLILRGGRVAEGPHDEVLAELDRPEDDREDKRRGKAHLPLEEEAETR